MKNRAGSFDRVNFAALLLISLAAISGCNTASPNVTQAPTGIVPTPSSTNTTLPSYTPEASNTPGVSATATPAPSGQVSLIAVGDLMLGRSVGTQILEKGPAIVFAGVQPVLDSADLRIGNLECALTDSGTPEPKKTYTLKAPPAAAAALQLGKFDLVSLANNHAMDYGYQGLQEAQKLLGQVGIATVGAGIDYTQAHTPVILERNGLRLAFLAYMDVPEERDGFNARDWIATQDQPGIAWANLNEITADVAAARAKADVVIVLLHSGLEIGEYMSIISSDQREEAHAAVDAGAAVVIGSHPHQLESIELYHAGLIAYSLGNFVFDDYRGIANATIILQIVLDRNGFQSYKYVPVLIENGLPQVITPAQAPAIGTLIAPLAP